MNDIYEMDKGIRPYDYFWKIMGGKWKPFIIRGIAYKGYARFNEMTRILGITPKVLQQQLTELQNDGIIKRVVHTEGPLRVDYIFTEDGEKLVPIYDLIYEWALERLERENATVAPYTYKYHSKKNTYDTKENLND